MKFDVDLNDALIQEQIVDQAVQVLLDSRYSPSELRRDIEKAVSVQVTERLNAVIGDAVAEMLSKPIQRYDTFGEPEGEPLSIESIVRNGANAYMTEKVDSNGKPTRDSFGSPKSRIERLIEEAVINGLSRDLKTEADRVKAELVKRASEAAAAIFAKIK